MSVEDQTNTNEQLASEKEDDLELKRKDSQVSRDSQTATEYINAQLQLEADAREVLPYSFDSCTYTLGKLRQSVFACLTCNPPPASPAQVFNPAGVCYSCSISCHGDHTLVELFNRRNFTCDCGTTRFSSTPCTLRGDPTTGAKGIRGDVAAKTNTYNQNFQNKFCACGEDYDPHQERGTMFQCIGLGTVETGGCGEDWYHPECVMGLSRDWYKSLENKEEKPKSDEISPSEAVDEGEDEAPVPPGFPAEDDFDTFICYKCVESNPWIKKYAGTPGFLAPVFKSDGSLPTNQETASAIPIQETTNSKKRKASEGPEDVPAPGPEKKLKGETEQDTTDLTATTTVHEPETAPTPKSKHEFLPSNPPAGTFSLFLQQDFREHLCHCPTCFPSLLPHPQLIEEEDVYEPPLSESSGHNGPGSGARSQGTGSLLERGEAALNNVDRVRAIEGVMVYNHLKDKVKEFLRPYAESGTAVGAEDIKKYFEQLRGDEGGIKEAGGRPVVGSGGGSGEGNGDGSAEGGDNRKEQSGY
ncbi:putative metaphase-anaphase transition protein [Phaeomoniella chlamydospora]|uniref:Putative metaphase-anaphase transition protein n=1 Tax=Phaeomoniella chlamydospora TaxID=158046 RepID=A0A0G2GV49_PHACM|nr:putative metaphase-anaphase transition protein [Phaeomoniella chlamydospora]